jgi:hypothetical protein
MSEVPTDPRKEFTAEIQVADVGTIEEPPNVEWRRDNLRARIALLLTYAVIVMMVVPIVAVVAFPASAAAIKEVTTVVIPATIGIYGSIIGFYFGRSR